MISSKNLTTISIAFCVAVYCMIVFDQPIISLINHFHDMNELRDYFFVVSAVLLMIIAINLVISLFAFKHIFKPWLIFLLLSAPVASYYMETYHILINHEMMRNVMGTDYQEAAGLFSWSLIAQVIITGLIPSAGIIVTPINYGSILKEAVNKFLVLLFSMGAIGLMAIVFYQDYASLFRNNRQLRDQLVPIDYLYGAYSYFGKEMSASTKKLKTTGEDAKLDTMWNENGKKVVSIIVVGETARASNFSLNNYSRQTNPELEKQNIINFENFYSCGTSTAYSVPCMFSNMGRKNYDATDAKHTEGLLDVIQRTGLFVLWRDNNSGCKGACDRVVYEDMAHIKIPAVCNTEECFDEILLHQLKETIDSQLRNGQKGAVIVLHQHGSHGPDYFQRAPIEYQRFTPSPNQPTTKNAHNKKSSMLMTTPFFIPIMHFL